ncbi:Glutathione gamma-glutamylcysteinyltransferase 1 [Morus notabilis]|uniref:glutathione gamma-glutamylcysteinyltransferase n=1 Tax=Morus notabilis TaxID=981085 RepID=W9QSJ2_9ROSA|nr:glutathione gamma-glutamylcysteinyltransferase 1 [Morus notabilis]AMR70492.1 phytochelatin synthase 1 [Morus notabilis]AOC38002.1 phytochelatin synthase [Morus notabilis]EXB53498.1 Glutathione gamma-glutamylcysteinyltransferase 1 [Morus notabilis]
MAMAGLYRRVLPSPPAIDFASSEGKQLFIEAIQSGTMENFYRLISYFQTQSEPAYCGLASLSMVLNALAIDPGRKWKGPWRWFDESMLDCCEPLEKVKARGISFGKLVCLAQCAGAKVEAFRTNHSTVDDFRKYVMRCSTSDDCHLISSYNRAALRQTGTGHFSPIGGYHAGKDMALILDVARFKYPPHWVPLKLLWEAMDHFDGTTGQRRGFMLIARPHRDPGQLYTLSCKHESWIGIAKYLMDDVPLLLKSDNVKDIQKVLSVVFTSLPSNFEEFIKWVAEVRRHEDDSQGLSPEEKARLSVKEEVLKQVQDTGLFKHVTSFLSSANLCCKHSITSRFGEDLQNIAASVCCQGAEILSGNSGSQAYCCQETCIRCLKANGDKPITVVSGTVVNGNTQQGVDVLVPSSQTKPTCSCTGSRNYTGLHPAGDDVLTALLLALPPETWSGIKEEKLLQEIRSLFSTENLPTLLQEEVLHLRRQLHLLKRCQENKVDEVLGAPLC